jgi:hypothetical protein
MFFIQLCDIHIIKNFIQEQTFYNFSYTIYILPSFEVLHQNLFLEKIGRMTYSGFQHFDQRLFLAVCLLTMSVNV